MSRKTAGGRFAPLPRGRQVSAAAPALLPRRARLRLLEPIDVDRFAAPAVLIADGGFQGNAGLVARHIAPAADALFQRGAGTGMGDGKPGEVARALLQLLQEDMRTGDRLIDLPA